MSILQEQLQNCIRDIDKILSFLGVAGEEADILREISDRYPISIPPYYLNLIDPSDPEDPIRKLCIPSAVEKDAAGHEDQSGETGNTVMTGVQHKYAQTALVLTTNQCSMYCRHCFRKRMVGYTHTEITQQIHGMREYVKAHPEINNVLLSGGDAFINENDVIREYLDHLVDLPNLDYIRFGTRTPVVLPMRIYDDPELLEILREYGKRRQIVIVTHFDHPREITEESMRAVRLLMEAGCPVRNQVVLLKGVNDSPQVLSQLLNKLVGIGVLPYYVFQCRPAKGVLTQFQVPLSSGYEIVEQAKALCSGQAKAFRYAMSHVTGKIEILGKLGDEMLFKYHQAKHREDHGRIFTMKVADDQCWLGDVLPSATGQDIM